MNLLVFAGGVLGTFATIGHFTLGSKRFLKPMLDSNMEEVPKKVMHSIYHFLSVFMILSSLALLMIGANIIDHEGFNMLGQFIAANYLCFTFWQIVLILITKIEGGLIKFYQWMIFFVISCLAWFGSQG